jgi:hypothetical protein
MRAPRKRAVGTKPPHTHPLLDLAVYMGLVENDSCLSLWLQVAVQWCFFFATFVKLVGIYHTVALLVSPKLCKDI